MVQKVTQWTMDCGCSVSFTWDSEHPQETRVHTAHQSHKVCDGHKHKVRHVDGVVDHHHHFATMLQHGLDRAKAEAEQKAG